MLHTVITNFAVRGPHGSVEPARLTELEFELPASKHNVEELILLLFGDV